MRNWNEYKEYVKKTDNKDAKELEEIEEQARIISKLINKRNALGLSQRDLAEICGLPQSSIARIESFKTTPNLSTLIKLLKPLGLKITIS